MGIIRVGRTNPKTVGVESKAVVSDRAVEVEAAPAADPREVRLAQIKAMPEQEQLALLVGEGFEEEAKALSEKLSSAEVPQEEVHQEEAPQEEAEAAPEEEKPEEEKPEPKKPGSKKGKK